MSVAIAHNSIPAELRVMPQWLTWIFEERLDKKTGELKATKVPLNPRTGRHGSSTSAADRTTFEEAAGSIHPHDGLGFVFVKGGGIVGIDLDNCIAEDGTLKDWAARIVAAFATYAEISPSGRGVKLWARGSIPAEKGTRKPYHDGAVEMYDWGRYFTVTGNKWADAPETITENQKYINGLWKKINPPAPASDKPAASVTAMSDQEIIVKLLQERATKAAALYQGNSAGYLSASEADAALCCKIAFYTKDPDQIDRIFRTSLLVREKWTEREDYRKETIDSALERVREGYKPGKAKPEAKPVAAEEAPAEEAQIKPPGNSAGLCQLIEDTISGKRKNMHWGWDMLTWAARALLPGTITVLCGGAGSTKSMMLSQASLYWLREAIPFAVFHLEEDREFHTNRALAQLANLSNLTLDDFVRENPDTVRSAYEQHMTTLDALSGCIWDAPTQEVTTVDLADWVRDRAKEGRRIIAVDPITAADSGSEPWIADRRFVNDTKRIMREFGASLIVVTHPRDGNPKHGSSIDNIAGGRAYNRFTQCVLMLESLDTADDRTVVTAFGRKSEPVNRIIKLRKARSGPGAGMDIGFFFDSKTLRFKEQGQITEEM